MMNKGCLGCKNAMWDADGCTCIIDGLLVGDVVRGCTERRETITTRKIKVSTVYGELLNLKKERQEALKLLKAAVESFDKCTGRCPTRYCDDCPFYDKGCLGFWKYRDEALKLIYKR